MRQTKEDYLIFQEPGESVSQHNDIIMMQVKKILKLFKKKSGIKGSDNLNPRGF